MYRNNRSLRTQEHSACLMVPFVFITGDQSPLENRDAKTSAVAAVWFRVWIKGVLQK